MKQGDVQSADEFLKQQCKADDLKGMRQRWAPESRTLSFGCGDGIRGIYIDSKRRLSKVIEPFEKTRLSREIVQRLQHGHKSKEGRELLGGVREVLDRYIHFPERSMSVLVALWVIGSYMYTIFGHYGYLFIYSSLKRSGKTRVLEVLHHLAFDATLPLNTPTVPAIREMASDGRVVLLDTLERWRSKSNESFAAAMELLDAGFRSGGTVTKMVRTGDEWRREDFPVYSPYALAGIGRESLADTALDRSFPIEMRRKDIRVKKERYEFHKCDTESDTLREGLYAWALANVERVHSVYHDPSIVSLVADDLGLNDRAADVWLPIFALAEAIGIRGGDRRGLEDLATSMGLDPDRKEDLERLEVVGGLISMCNKNGIVLDTTESLLARLTDQNISVEIGRFHEVMSLVGVEQTSNRIGADPRRSWRIGFAPRRISSPTSPASRIIQPIPIKTHESRAWCSSRRLRDRRFAGCRRHGRGVSRARYTARARCCD